MGFIAIYLLFIFLCIGLFSSLEKISTLKQEGTALVPGMDWRTLG